MCLEGKSNIIKKMNAGFMLLMLVMQWFPFWSYEGRSVSIGAYFWLPKTYKDMDNFLVSVMPDYHVNSFAYIFLIITLVSVAGIVLALWKSKFMLVSLFPLAAGVLGVYAFSTRVILQMGSTWIVQLLLYAVMALLAVMAFVIDIMEKKKK